MMFGQGVSQTGCILDLAVENKLIEKSGAWFSLNGEKIAQGKENAKAYLARNPELMRELEAKIREIVAHKGAAEQALGGVE